MTIHDLAKLSTKLVADIEIDGNSMTAYFFCKVSGLLFASCSLINGRVSYV